MLWKILTPLLGIAHTLLATVPGNGFSGMCNRPQNAGILLQPFICFLPGLSNGSIPLMYFFFPPPIDLTVVTTKPDGLPIPIPLPPYPVLTSMRPRTTSSSTSTSPSTTIATSSEIASTTQRDETTENPEDPTTSTDITDISTSTLNPNVETTTTVSTAINSTFVGP